MHNGSRLFRKFCSMLTTQNASCGRSTTSPCHFVDVTRTCSSPNECNDGETCLHSYVYVDNNYTSVCEQCQYLDIYFWRNAPTRFPVTDIEYCNTTIVDSPSNVTIPSPNQPLSCKTARDCPTSYSCIAITDKPRQDFGDRRPLNYSVISCENGDGFPCYSRSIGETDSCNINTSHLFSFWSVNSFCASTFRRATPHPGTFETFQSNCVHCDFLGNRKAPDRACDQSYFSQPPASGKNASHLQSCLQNYQCDEPLDCVSVTNDGEVINCESQSHDFLCLEQERCATYFPCSSGKQCTLLPGTSISICVPQESLNKRTPTPEPRWTIPYWLIKALASIELLFVVLKTMLVIAKPSRRILKIFIIAFFVAESILGLSLTIYLSIVVYTISNISFLDDLASNTHDILGNQCFCTSLDFLSISNQNYVLLSLKRLIFVKNYVKVKLTVECINKMVAMATNCWKIVHLRAIFKFLH